MGGGRGEGAAVQEEKTAGLKQGVRAPQTEFRGMRDGRDRRVGARQETLHRREAWVPGQET